MLRVRELRAGYRRDDVLRGVSFDVAAGEIVALMGRNGAGKTTLARVLAGLHRPRAGAVHIDGRDVTGRPPRQIVRAGFGLVSEGRRVFGSLTVDQNLAVAGEPDRCAEVYRLFPALAGLRDRSAATLSGGEQQLLVIGRGLMAAPRLLAVDEPSCGLAPSAIDDVANALRAVREAGATVLLIEHHLPLAQEIADRVLVLDDGRVQESSFTDGN